MSDTHSCRSFIASAGAGPVAHSADRVLGTYERIHIAVVGCAGTGHLSDSMKRAEADNIAVPALCDVYARRLERAKKICGGAGSSEYRELLDRKDVNAILIATPTIGTARSPSTRWRRANTSASKSR